MEEMHLACRVAAKLLAGSYKILRKPPEADGFYISQKTSRSMSIGIPGCLTVITDSEIKLSVSEQLPYQVASEYICLNLLRTEPWEILTQERECWTGSL